MLNSNYFGKKTLSRKCAPMIYTFRIISLICWNINFY